MLAALAWVCGDAVLLVRTRGAPYAITGMLAYSGGLLFFEKSGEIPAFVAFTVASLLCWVDGRRNAPAWVWRRGIRLWVPALALTAALGGALPSGGRPEAVGGDLAMTWDLLRRSVTHGIVPGLQPGTVAVAALGSRLAVGGAAAGGDGPGLGGTGGGADGVACCASADSDRSGWSPSATQ